MCKEVNKAVYFHAYQKNGDTSNNKKVVASWTSR
jgi:hypothetical protein